MSKENETSTNTDDNAARDYVGDTFSAAKKAIVKIDKADAKRGASFIVSLENEWLDVRNAIALALKMTGGKNLSSNQKERMGLPAGNDSPLAQKWAKIIGSLKKVDVEDWAEFVLFVRRTHEGDKRLSYTSIRTACDAFYESKKDDTGNAVATLDATKLAQKVLKLCETNKVPLKDLLAAIAANME